MGKVYFLTDTHNVKIGFTSGEVNKRLKQLNTGSPYQLYILWWVEGDLNKEKELHDKFSYLRIKENGEWFEAGIDLIKYINEVNEKPNTYVDSLDGVLMTFLKL